jgi:hypothetical protein
MNELEQRVNGLEVRISVAEKRVDIMEKNIEKIENNTAWAVKLIVGQVILGIIGFLFLKGGL